MSDNIMSSVTQASSPDSSHNGTCILLHKQEGQYAHLRLLLYVHIMTVKSLLANCGMVEGMGWDLCWFCLSTAVPGRGGGVVGQCCICMSLA